jgi:hypothetical protein
VAHILIPVQLVTLHQIVCYQIKNVYVSQVRIKQMVYVYYVVKLYQIVIVVQIHLAVRAVLLGIHCNKI